MINMIALYIILGVLLAFIICLFIVALLAHNKFFNYHYYPDPYIDLYTSDEFNLEKEEVNIKYKKYTLRGYLFKKDLIYNDKIIIYAHGMWSNYNSYMQDIAYLALKGYLVLGFNYLGVDTSDGKTIKGFANSLNSLSYAIKYVRSTPNLKDKDIYVVGHSWGGFTAVNIIKYHKDIKKICAISPFLSEAKLLKNSIKGLSRIIIPFMVLIDFIKCGPKAFSNGLKALKKYDGKALLIASTDDRVVPFNDGVKLVKEKINKDNIKYIIEENKKHHPHYTLNAVNNMSSFEAKIRGMKHDELIEYKKNYNFHEMGELDPVIMDQIVEFLND